MADREIIYRYGQEGLEDLQRKLLEMAGAAQTAAKHIGEGSKTGSAGLKALDEATRQAKGVVDDFAGRAGPAGAIIAKLGPAGLAAAAGIGAVTAGMGFAIREAAKAEREMAKIEDRLRAQGGAARTSARELDGYANAVARTSSTTEAELKAVLPEILGFQNIIGSTFKDVLEFSVNGIGSLSTNAIALAKALNDPFNELQALQKAFPALTDAQLESIKATAQQNGVFAAQAEIFADLRASVGGAGSAEADTLIGMYDGLRKAADHWTEAAGANIVRLQGFRDLMREITGFIEKQTAAWGPEAQISRREAQLSVMNPHDPQAKRIHEEIDALRLLIKAQADEEAALERLRARQREYADRNDKNARAIKAAEEEVTQYLEGVAKKAKAEEDLNKKIVEQRQEMYRQLALQREQESRAFAADMEKLRIDLEKSLKGPDAEFQTLPQVQAWIDEAARAAERIKAINDETARDSYRAWREMFVDVLSNDIKNIGDLLGSLKNVGTNWAASHLANQTSNWANNALTASFGEEGASRIKSALATILAVTNLAGSIFGPRPSDRMEGVTRHFNPDGTVSRTEQDLGLNKDSPENRAAVNALDTAVMSFIDSLKSYGLQTSGLWAYAVEAGSGNSLQPFQAHVNNSGTRGFATAEDAFKWVADQLVDTLGTVPARLQTIVDSFDGSNVEQFFHELERVQNFETTLANVSSDLLKITDPEAWDIKQVTDWFKAMEDEAIALGYDITSAIFKPVLDLRDAQLAGIAGRYHPVTPGGPASPTAPLEATANWLQVIGGLYDKRIDQLQDEAAALRDAASAWDNIGKAIKQTRSSLLIDPTLSPLSLEARRGEAFSQLQAAYDAAKGGDKDAAAQLPELARAALTASREFYRSSEDYFADFNRVQNMLGAAQSYAEQQVDVARQSLSVQMAIFETLQNQRGGLGSSGARPSYNAADVANITTEFQAAWQRSGLSRSDFLASDEGQNIWLPIRQQWIAGISDQAQLTASLQAARSQKSEGGYAASDAVLFEQQVTNRMRELGFDVPSMAVGGMVRRTGLVYAHQGEHITPAGGMSGIEKTVARMAGEMEGLSRLLVEVARRDHELLGRIADSNENMERNDSMAAINARNTGRGKVSR